MADLIPSNDGQQEMAKQVEAIAEAAAQHDSQIAQMLNLVPKAAALSTAASRAINFTKKTWVDDPTSGTPITAADMNRLEQAIVDLNTTLTSVQNSLSQLIKVKTFTGMTTDNGILYTSLNSRKCVVVSASSSKLIDGEAVLCAPLVNKVNYGISCRSATYPHEDFKSMELSITVYYIELIA